jgi:hypothetical protein
MVWMNYVVIGGFVGGEGFRLSTAILLALGSLQVAHLWNPFRNRNVC